MAKYYCVLFDADNTLLDFDAAENKALADTLREYGIEPDAETVQTTAPSTKSSGGSWKRARSAGTS